MFQRVATYRSWARNRISRVALFTFLQKSTLQRFDLSSTVVICLFQRAAHRCCGWVSVFFVDLPIFDTHIISCRNFGPSLEIRIFETFPRSEWNTRTTTTTRDLLVLKLVSLLKKEMESFPSWTKSQDGLRRPPVPARAARSYVYAPFFQRTLFLSWQKKWTHTHTHTHTPCSDFVEIRERFNSV